MRYLTEHGSGVRYRPHMSTLRSALDEVVAVDVSELPDDELIEHVVELERASRVLEAARARAVAEVDKRRIYERDGFVSVTAWLRSLGVPGSVAAQHVRLARTLEHMPATASALTAGEIAPAAAGVLADAYEADPEQFRRDEQVLVDAARTWSLPDLRRAIERWTALADSQAADEAAARRFDRRALYVSSTLDGMVRLDGDLDPETGQVVLAAIGSVVDADVRSDRSDTRRPVQRRADALGDICRAYLDRSDRAVVAGERPHLLVQVDLDALVDGTGSGALNDAGTVTAKDVRRLACDAAISRLVRGPGSEPLDLGRRTPVVLASLRRAILARDRGCRFPGCDRPDRWCDCHHVVHWADGGETDLSNLILLCRRHHRLVHDRFGLELRDGRPVFSRPDRTVLEDRAPP